MKKTIILIISFLFLTSYVYASDLSDYPSFYVKGNDLDVIIAIADEGPGTDALAQTQIALSLAQFGNALGISKLESEIEYEEQNIISIGSPCYNRITAEIMDDPVPCDEDLTEGKAFIRIYQHNNNVQIVVAGYNAEATREIANILRDYPEHDLKGQEYIINTKPEVKEEKNEVEEEKKPEVKEEIKEEKERIAEESKKIEENQQKNEIEVKPVEQKEEKKELNMIQRMVNWLKGIFGVK
ncbi:hypothetical protein ISS05_02090 [Candidatus Woesearchaeota archaeon]|nr:hypothetical protein [Candidatus Woesearchaeota archaeon]